MSAPLLILKIPAIFDKGRYAARRRGTVYAAQSGYNGPHCAVEGEFHHGRRRLDLKASKDAHMRPWLLSRAIAAFAILAAVEACGGDWPQILGPHRNGRAEGEQLAESWPRGGPKVL